MRVEKGNYFFSNFFYKQQFFKFFQFDFVLELQNEIFIVGGLRLLNLFFNEVLQLGLNNYR